MSACMPAAGMLIATAHDGGLARTCTNVDAQPGHAEHKSTKEDAGGTRDGAKGIVSRK